MERSDIWKELRHLGLLPKPKGALHGFGPDELNAHFAGVSISPLEGDVDVDNLIMKVPDEGFKFKPVTIVNVVHVISHSPLRPEVRMGYYKLSFLRLFLLLVIIK